MPFRTLTPAPVIPIDANKAGFRRPEPGAAWSLLEIERPGGQPEPLGILLLDDASGGITLRLRAATDLPDLDEQATDIVSYLAEDLLQKARESGGHALLTSLEASLSGFLRISDRTPIRIFGSPERTADRLYDDHVDGTVRPFITHIPVYGLRAAATKFGEGMSGEVESWHRAPAGLRLTEDLFAAWVVGRSMEPLIPDGSLCVFRANVRGTRQGKRLLIEKFDETDFAARYTVKKYTSVKVSGADEDEWTHQTIRLEPLNSEFEAFNLVPDAFRVVAEFVEVLL